MVSIYPYEYEGTLYCFFLKISQPTQGTVAQNILPGSLTVYINKLKYFATSQISRVREYADSVQVVSCHRIRSFNEDDDICVFLVDRNEIPDTNIC